MHPKVMKSIRYTTRDGVHTAPRLCGHHLVDQHARKCKSRTVQSLKTCGDVSVGSSSTRRSETRPRVEKVRGSHLLRPSY